MTKESLDVFRTRLLWSDESWAFAARLKAGPEITPEQVQRFRACWLTQACIELINHVTDLEDKRCAFLACLSDAVGMLANLGNIDAPTRARVKSLALELRRMGED